MHQADREKEGLEINHTDIRKIPLHYHFKNYFSSLQMDLKLYMGICFLIKSLSLPTTHWSCFHMDTQSNESRAYQNRTFPESRRFLQFHQKHEKLTAKQNFNWNHVKLSCWETDSRLMAKIYGKEVCWRTCDSNLRRFT